MKPLSADERAELPARIGRMLESRGWSVETEEEFPSTLYDLSNALTADGVRTRVILTCTAPNGIDTVRIDCGFEGPEVCSGVSVFVFRRVPGLPSCVKDENRTHGVLAAIPHTERDVELLLHYLDDLVTAVALSETVESDTPADPA